MSKIHVGMMLICERGVDETPERSVLMGNYELRLLDGSVIDKSRYPGLSKLLRRNGFGNRLPNDTQDLDIQDHYVVAKRLSKDEVSVIKEHRG